MPRRKKLGGARAGAGRKPASGTTRSTHRKLSFTPAEAAAIDAAAEREGSSWTDWVRAAAELALARGSTR
jgi:hypothetical protein